ncbi:hypothetical protein SAMN05877809_105294 [Rhodobacter sp. JA431]|uniref:hypothetical protein n=1 Tax=Rhodobacter sp. JA431 TaxID=570013 RepID=UPI000BD9A3DF|nr:hypothetical protein [Rhodobacter sp. JA431]SOC11472.1 hypothetical protein SAMN05877809_105294 [Rhodobacter sp. JA431]
MALSFPYALDFLSDHIKAAQIPLTLRRFDETSGTARGQVWSTQLAPPIWTATVPLVARSWAEARAVDAKILALDGMAKTFLWADPAYMSACYGRVGGNVTVASVSSDRTAIGLSGLPPGYPVSIGDRLSVAHGTDRVWFATFAEEGVADAAGDLAELSVYPYVPFGVSVGAAVEMDRPYFKAMVEDYTGFSAMPGKYSQGASLTLLQKV